MKKRRLLLHLIIPSIMAISCFHDDDGPIVKIFPDSIIHDVSHHPIGINLNFFMDDGRFPDADRSTSDALKELGMKYLRYPGGEKSDLYLFSKPPYARSQPGITRSSGLTDYPGMFTEDLEFVYDPLDFDEYMAMCRELNAEPVVVVAADCYLIPLKKGEWVTPREDLIRHAEEWVRYANITKQYGVRYWMVANESWNPNNINSTAEIYARDVIDFSRAMKGVDPSVLIIANGDSDDFFKTVIERAGDHIDGLTWSNYGIWDFYRGYQSYKDTARVLIRPSLTALRAVEKYATPEQKQRFKLMVAEYGSIDWFRRWNWNNDMGHAIVTFDMTGQLLLQPEIEFSCFWNTRWIENETNPHDHDALDKDGNLLPTGKALRIWNNFMGTQMVRSDGSEGLITFSSYDPGTGVLFSYLVNRGDQLKSIRFDVQDHKVLKILEAWELHGTSPEDMEPQWNRIIPCEPGKPVNLKGTSISVIKMKIIQNK